jgi:hypothetical protein
VINSNLQRIHLVLVLPRRPLPTLPNHPKISQLQLTTQVLMQYAKKNNQSLLLLM